MQQSLTHSYKAQYICGLIPVMESCRKSI